MSGADRPAMPRLRGLSFPSVQDRIGTFIVVLVAGGIVARAIHYASPRPLWLDEALLALNIIHRPDFSPPLDLFQIAPLGFLWLEKTLVQLFGPGEHVLRSVAFAAGLVSVMLFPLLMREARQGWAWVWGVGLFAFMDRIVYYSSEVKQYGGDLALAVAVMVLTARLLRRDSRAGLSLVAVIGATGVWLSHPLIYILATAGLVLFARAIQQRRLALVAVIVAIGSAWLASFALAYWMSKPPADAVVSVGMAEFWRAHFPPLSRSPVDIQWYFRGPLRPFAETLGLPQSGIAAVFFVVGSVWLWRKDRWLAMLVLMPLALVFVTAAAQLYPFGGRLMTFAGASLVLPLALGIEATRERLVQYARYAHLGWVTAVALLLAEPSGNFAYQITKEPPWSRDRFDRVIADVARAKGANDAVYVYFYSVAPFMYYAPRFGWDVMRSGFGDFSVTNDHVVRGAPPDLAGLLSDFENLSTLGKPIWAIFSHPIDGINERQLLHHAVLQRGGTIETVSVHGTAVAYRIQFP